MGKSGFVIGGAVALFLFAGVSVRLLNHDDEGEKDGSGPTLPTNFREPIRPTGSVKVTLNRVETTYSRLADMNDRGDILYIVSKLRAKTKLYVHEFQGKVIEKRSIEEDRSFNLGPDGILIPTRIDSPIDRASAPLFPFTDDLAQPMTGSDSTLLVVRRKHDPKTGKDHYGLDRDKQLPDSSKNFNVPVPIEVTSRVTPAPTQQTVNAGNFNFGGGLVGSGGDPIDTKEIYQSIRPLTLLEKSENNTIWIKEHTGNRATGSDELISIEKSNRTVHQLPLGYSDVIRVVNTGKHIAATFGRVEGTMPIRSYIQAGDQWKELPIPEKYDFSFVQRIFNDGTILGFITSADGQKIRQVVWKGDACTILDDLDHWPHQGLYSIVVLSNRRGDIYVRNVLNSKTNASEYYLLNILVKP